MKEKFAKMMLEHKLDFLPLEQSLELHNAGIKLKTRFSWVVCTEELGDDLDNMSIEEILEIHADIYGDNDKNYLKIGKAYNEFDEFTFELCPAPTYTDLI